MGEVPCLFYIEVRCKATENILAFTLASSTLVLEWENIKRLRGHFKFVFTFHFSSCWEAHAIVIFGNFLVGKSL